MSGPAQIAAAGYRNLLEPEALAALFLRHPPVGFGAQKTAGGQPIFYTDFDLLTTLDASLLRKLRALPLYRWWSRALRFPTRFAGTTVTEYAPLPVDAGPEDMLDGLLAPNGQRQALTIIKDLPRASPLLGEADNLFAEALTARAARRGFIAVEGQALAYVPITFDHVDQYLAGLSRARRKDIRRKMRGRERLDISRLPLGDPAFDDPAFLEQLYAMYLAVYEQSEVHFDLLSREFFTAFLRSGEIRGLVVFYRHQGTLAGYNICLLHNDLLIDKYIGLVYPMARELNLYFVSWLVNLELALEHGCTAYVAGWTDPEVKAGLGASFTLTRHLVWVKNPLLRALLRPLRHLFESDSRTMRGKA